MGYQAQGTGDAAETAGESHSCGLAGRNSGAAFDPWGRVM